jgi:multidrug efflux pump subunit AcrB
MSGQDSAVSRLVAKFLTGNLSVLLIIVTVVAGVFALAVTPREEEPQIVVPLADVIVQYPGGSAEEVERMVSSRLERLLYQIDGVEYVYSMSRPEMAVVTVRFHVGQDREASLIKLYNKVFQNVDRTTPGISGWVVKPVEIDDVPVVSVALYSKVYDPQALYRVAEEVAARLQHIPDSAAVTIHGGQKRVVSVDLDMERVAAYGLSVGEVAGALRAANAQSGSGSFSRADRTVKVQTGPFIRSAAEAGNLVVGAYTAPGFAAGRPVYLRDVAAVTDGAEEAVTYSRIGFGPAARAAGDAGSDGFHAVTVAVAKKKGSNAVRLAGDVEKSLAALRGAVLPDEVQARITRDYGATADDKVNNLVESLAIAIITVIGLVALVMNWRVGIIVVIAVPVTYALTLLVNYMAGYTINRVTLFALILALGLIVDDPIVGVENIYRHLSARRKPPLRAITDAMDEVMPPIILATLAVVVAFLPMFFITGMMGPYMRPMALNVPLAMMMSMLVAFTITPWLSRKLLKVGEGDGGHDGEVDTSSLTYRAYSRLIRPFVVSKARSAALFVTVGILLAGAALLPMTGLVPLKMLPFDNRNEIQFVIDMPETATLEATDAVVRDVERYLGTVPEVKDFTSVAGAASPMDFNGLVRHYYMRQGPNVADVRVNLVHRTERRMNSHAIVLRIRKDVEELARRTGASIKVVEVPPGPPVLATLVAEVYGRPHHSYADLVKAAGIVRDRMAREAGVVDLDDSVEAQPEKFVFVVDREKAGLSGISVEDISMTLRAALHGAPAGVVHAPGEQNELPMVLRLPREQRSDVAQLRNLVVKGRTGQAVTLGELGRFDEGREDVAIYHKNQERVVFVTAETAGRGPAYPVLALQSHFDKHPLPDGLRVVWSGEGEWKITLDVFRDLGIAFAVALLAIYVLLVYQTRSYALSGVIMTSIPFTLIGVMPGFWLLNALFGRTVGGYADPVFFTATAMIGMIALAGIVVRNGIILIDFISTAVARGVPVDEAIVQSGAVRLRPIFLTAGSAVLGAWPITLDPIFSGLAWALIFGLVASTAFTLLVIPVAYHRLGASAAAGPAES